MRHDGRSSRELRSPAFTCGFHGRAEGSVLYRVGGTVVLCTASVDASVPKFMTGRGEGWITAEYQMHPRANEARQDRDGRGKALGGRTQEIQRLIGRSLRAAVDRRLLGERTITIDCDVLEADGGTRTASITGGFVALALALGKLRAKDESFVPCLVSSVAAVSAGIVEGHGALLDLAYVEDSNARVDLNVIATGSGAIVEIQGTAEGEPVPRKDFDDLTTLALEGIETLSRLQAKALGEAGVELGALLRAGQP
jgi:ribonuclease PH